MQTLASDVHPQTGGLASRVIVLVVGLLPPAVVAAGAAAGAAPGDGSALGSALRLCGVLTAIVFPGALLAPLLGRWKGAEGRWDPTSFGLVAYGLTVLAHLANVTALKLLGIPVTPLAALALGGMEAAVALAVGWRRPAVFDPPSRSGALAAALATALVVGWAAADRAALSRDLDSWYYHPAPMAWGYDGVDLREARVTYEGPGEVDLTSGAAQASVLLRHDGAEAAPVRLLYLLQGPMGGRLSLDCGGDGQDAATLTRDVVEEADEGPVARYQDRGIVGVTLTLDLAPGQAAACDLRVAGADGASRLLDFTAHPDWQVHEESAALGLHLAHYYQILNIVENVRWAEEVLGHRWLTINQPPLWSYAYSAVVLYAGSHLVAAHLYFYLLVLGLALVGFRAVRVQEPRIQAAFMLPVALMALSHARIITASGSANFPDNLYALALLSAFFGLMSGQRGLYVGAGLAATFLRYPGSTVVVLMAALTALLDGSRRRAALSAGGVFVGILLAPLALLGVFALATGQLGSWLEILWFETFPEHFHGEYGLAALLPRPLEFYGLWLKYAGYTPLLLVGLRGRVARVAFAVAATYSGLLCFIDHFPSHYFLPLLALTGVAVTASVARWRRPLDKVGLALASGGLVAWLVWGVA